MGALEVVGRSLKLVKGRNQSLQLLRGRSLWLLLSSRTAQVRSDQLDIMTYFGTPDYTRKHDHASKIFPFRWIICYLLHMPKKTLSERLNDCESTENNLQTELVALSSRLKALEDENNPQTELVALSSRLKALEDENNPQTELVALSSRLKALEDENSQLRQDIKDAITYVELINAQIASMRSFRSQEQANQFNAVKARLHARYASRETS